MIRCLLALGLGASMLFIRNKSLPMLGNFMGLFWLLCGAVALRWGIAGGRTRRLAIVAGAIGVVAGLVMLARWLVLGEGFEDEFATALGVIIVLTGLLHIFEGFPTGEQRARRPGAPRKRSWTSVLLGAFEVVLGVLLIVSPLSRDYALFYGAAAFWALVGGLILVGDALGLRRVQRQQSWQEGQPLGAEQDWEL